MNNLIKSINIKEFKFTNFPKKTTIKEYNNALNFLCNKAKRNKDIISVYQIGEVSNPGISDIDIILVVKNKVDAKKIEQLEKICIKKHGYYFMHNFFIVNKEIFSNLDFLYPLFNKEKLIYGEKLTKNNKNKLNKEQLKKENLAILVDFINFFWPREYLDFLLDKKNISNNKYLNKVLYCIAPLINTQNTFNAKKEINIRYALCRLNSLKYSIITLENLTGKRLKHERKFIKKITDLRKEWFSLPNKKEILLEEIKNTLITSINFIEKLDKVLCKELKESKNKIDKEENKHIIFTMPFVNCYIKNWNKNKCLAKSVEMYKKKRIIVSYLPQSFLENNSIINMKQKTNNKQREESRYLKNKKEHFKFLSKMNFHSGYFLYSKRPMKFSAYTIYLRIYMFIKRVSLKLLCYKNKSIMKITCK